MAYRDLLLLLDDSRGAAGRTKAAASFAKKIGAEVEALHLSMHQEIPGYIAAEMTASVLALRDETIATETAKAKEAFEAACKASGITGRFEQVTAAPGELADAAVAAARLCDLAVLGQPDEEEGGWIGPWLLESVLLGSGRPALVVPYIGAHETIGRRVLVAWDGGREAARAVADSLPILIAAEKVTVLSVNREADRQHPGTAAISEHLARHGVKVDHHDIRIDDLSAADYMLNRASDEDADLLVMGAYAHSRIRELVLGGMTKGILRHMTVPVFLSH